MSLQMVGNPINYAPPYYVAARQRRINRQLGHLQQRHNIFDHVGATVAYEHGHAFGSTS
jgi:hypothetical protein